MPYLRGFPGRRPKILYSRRFRGWSGTAFRFMFFDALSPTYLEGFRAFYVFCPIFTEFRGVL